MSFEMITLNMLNTLILMDRAALVDARTAMV